MSHRQPSRIEPSTEAGDSANRILQERDKLVDLAWACTDEQWESSPLGAEDPRRVLVIADHAARVEMRTRRDVTAHLVRSGDKIAALVRGLTDEQLALCDGRVARLAAIAVRHADNHRREIAAALGIELATTDDGAGE